jgi:phasin family protein
MMNTSSDMIHAIKANCDAFMELSKIAISSIEQLTTLNLNTARSTLEESTAAAALMLDSNAATPSFKTKKLTSIAVSEQGANYFRSLQDIASNAQEETTKLMKSYLSSQGNSSSHHAGWTNGFDAFIGLGQQLSDFTEASRKALANEKSRVVNQTNKHSPQSA